MVIVVPLNELTTVFTNGVPTYTLSGTRATWKQMPEGTYEIVVAGDTTNLLISNTTTDIASQVGSVTFENSSSTQTLTYNAGKYQVSNIITQPVGIKTIIFDDNAKCTITNLLSGSGILENATVYIGEGGSLIVQATSGMGTIKVGLNSDGDPRNTSKLKVLGVCTWNVEIWGNYCTVDVSNCPSLTVMTGVIGTTLRGSSNAVVVETGAIGSTIVGNTNTVADSGSSTNTAAIGSTAPSSGAFGNIKITDNKIESLTGDIELKGTDAIFVSNITKSTNSTDGAFVVTGGIGVGDDSNFAGNVGIVKGMTIGDTVILDANKASTSSSTGSLILTGNGGIGVGGNINAGGIIKVANTTNSFGTTSGALVVAGGVGIAKDLIVGGNIVLPAYATVDGVDVSILSDTVYNLNTVLGLGGVTAAEVAQLTNINSTTISSTNWSNLGTLDQSIGTTSTPSFVRANISNISIGADSGITGLASTNTIVSSNTNGNINIIPNGTGEVILKADPVSALGACTKQYVDTMSAGLDFKASCIARCTGFDISKYSFVAAGAGVGKTLTATIRGALVLDGVTLSQTNRVFFDTGSNNVSNGIYVVTNAGSGTIGAPSGTFAVLTRASDADGSGEITSGMFTFVENGTSNGGKGFILITTGTITIDTTPLKFTQFLGNGSFTASNLTANGIGVYDSVTGANFNFRSINCDNSDPNTSGLVVALNGNDITLSINHSSISHTNLANLGTDDHIQYAMLDGRTDGQTICGGVNALDNLVLRAFYPSENIDISNGVGAVLVPETTSAIDENSGALVIGGGVGIGDNMFVGNSATFGTKNARGDALVLTAIGRSQFQNDAQFDSSVSVNGSISAANISASSATISIATISAISSSTITTSTVIINGTTNSVSTGTGALTVTGGVGVGGNIYSSGLNVSGATTFGGAVLLTAATPSINSSNNLTIYGRNTTNGVLSLQGNSTSTATGSVAILSSSAATSNTTAGCTIAGGLGVGANLMVGTYNINSNTIASTSNATITSAGTITLNANVGTGAIALTGASVTSSSNLISPIHAGSLVAGGSMILRANTVDNAGTITIPSQMTNTNSTNSTSASTGALVVTGGIGVGGAVNIGGVLGVGGTITIGGNITNTTNGSTTITGSGAASGTLTLVSTSHTTKPTAGIYISDSIASNSASTGALVVVGGVGIGGNTNIGGTISIGGNTVSLTSANANNITSSGTLTIISTGNLTMTATGGSVVSASAHSITNSTASTSSSTGALIVAGGIGVGGNLYSAGVISGANLIGTTNIISPIHAGSSVAGGSLTLRANTIDNTGTITILSGLACTANVASTSNTTGTLVVTGGMGISGATNIGGTLGVTGAITFGSNIVGTSASSITITGSAGASNFLTLIGTSNVTKGTIGVYIGDTITSSSTSTGALVVAGGVGISGATNIGGTLGVTGNATIGGTLGVTGAASFASTSFSLTNIGSNNISSAGALTISSAGNLTLTATGGNVVSSSPHSITNNTASSSISTGALVVTGGIGVGGAMYVGGAGTFASMSITNGLTVGTTFSATTNIVSPIHAGSVTAGGSMILRGNMSDLAGGVIILSTTSSTNSSTGALMVSGGVGIGGKLYVGSDIGVTGHINLAGNITSTNGASASSMVVTGSAGANGFLTLTGTSNTTKGTTGVYVSDTIGSSNASTGAFVVAGGVGVGGNTNVGGALGVTGATTIGGNLVVTGSATFGSTSISTINASSGNLTLSSTNGNVTSANVVTLTNSTASTSISNGALVVSGGIGVAGNIYSGGTGTFNVVATPSITSAGALSIQATSTTIAAPTSITNNTTSNSTTTGALVVTGGVGVGGTITTNALATNSLTGSGTLSLIGATGIALSSASGSVSVASANIVTIANNTSSTNSTLGALVVTGGIGCSDNITISKNISIGGATSSYNSGVGVMYYNEVSTEPSGNTGAGVNQYSLSEKLITYGYDYVIHDGSTITVRVKTVAALATNTANGTTIVANANGTLSAIDGVTMVVGDYVFVDSASAVSSTCYGVYKITSIGSAGTTWSMTRALFANTPTKFKRGTKIVVSDGTTMGGTIWIHTTNKATGATFTFSTVLTFAQLGASSGTITGASNLGSGTGLYASTSGSSLQFNSITAGTGIALTTTNNTITISSNGSAIDHNTMNNLTVGDVHTQYVILAGRTGGQTIYGGKDSASNLTLQGNLSSASSGSVLCLSDFGVSRNIYSTSEVMQITGGTSGGSGLILTGSTMPSANLELRSTTNGTKGSVIVSENTTSTTKNTGALLVTGGIGCADNVSIGKNCYIGNGTANYNSGNGIIHLDNANTIPSAAPNTGVHLMSIENKFVANNSTNGYTISDVSTITVRTKTVTGLSSNTANGITIVSNNHSQLEQIDGVTMVVGDLIFVDSFSNITPESAYGVYTVTSIGVGGTSWSFVRSDLLNTSEKFKKGLQIYVQDGAICAGSIWYNMTNAYNGSSFALNTDTLIFNNLFGNQMFVKNPNRISSTVTGITNFTTIHSTLNTPILPPGNYRVSWKFETTHTSTSVTYAYRVMVDDTTSLTGTSSTGQYINRANTAYNSSAGFFQLANWEIITFTTPASHSIVLAFNAGTSATAYMKNSTILIERL